MNRTPRIRAARRVGVGSAALIAALTSVSPIAAQEPAAAGTGTATLEGRGPCPPPSSFDCATLTVPLDHSGSQAGDVTLPVELTRNDDAPRGVLVFLTGGPGQPGVTLLGPVLDHYLTPEVKSAYQVVMLDQRGTGAGALDCPALQATVGSSDYWDTPRDATVECGNQLGDTRELYGTDDTVQDLELLRQSLGVTTMALDGVSYGTFVAEQYGRTFPEHVSRMVLDSPVPQDGFDTLPLLPMHRTGVVLRDACRKDESCTTDPARDLAWLVRHGRIDGRPLDGTHLLDMMAVLSVSTVNPTFDGIPELLSAARAGDTTQLAQLLDATTPLGARPEDLSAGLHMATLCGDLRFPWGDSSAPMAGRAHAVSQELAHTSGRAAWPYTLETAARVLEISGCSAWQPTPPTAYHPGPLLTDTLILSGQHDLFCPTPWARWQRRHTPRGRLLVVPNVGHATQRATVSTSRDAVAEFLLTP